MMAFCTNKAKKSQITLFALVSILLIALISIILYFALRPTVLPSKLQPVENSLLECMSDIVNDGVFILSGQGGYINVPEQELGSEFAPTGSQLNFFGSPVPYWFYVSANNVFKEQVPSLKGIGDELKEYIEDNIEKCSFDDFIGQGYSVSTDEKAASASVVIQEHEISIKLKYPVTITFADTTKRVSSHDVKVANELGSIYSLAKTIYETEQQKLFLEDYAVDVLALNAPTTGAEVTCAPKIWNKEKVEGSVKAALQDNTRAIKLKGSYYSLAKEENKYFVYDIGKDVSENIVFYYSTLFPTKFEVWPSEDIIMRADPIGTQESLGALGLCYVPYHFVYSLSYPILVQIYDRNNNLFQFPIVVVIDRSQPRKATITEASGQFEAEICKTKPEDLTVYTKDARGDTIESKIQFKCSNALCDIGSTAFDENKEAVLKTKVPQCINGFILASAHGYAESKTQISTTQPATLEVILQPYYDIEVVPNMQLKENESILLNFVSDNYVTNVVYPEQKKVKLTEGIYDVAARIFKKGNIKLSSQTARKCIKTPADGIAGVFGVEREECYDMAFPAQDVEYILGGGGKAEFSATEYNLRTSSKLKIDIPQFNIPKTITDLQNNYQLLDASEIEISLE